MTSGYVRHREGDIHDTQAVAWREGRWIICALAGKVVARRYTRTKPRTARFRFDIFNSEYVLRDIDQTTSQVTSVSGLKGCIDKTLTSTSCCHELFE